MAIDLLLELAFASHTTEMPRALAEKWDKIASRVEAIDPAYLAWRELAQHYRT